MSHLSRRAIVFALSACVLAPNGLAQQAANPVFRIGVLHGATRDDAAAELDVVRARLRESGFIEGENLRIEYRFAGYDYQKLDAMARELVRGRVQLIYAPNTTAVAAAQAATKSIPIVFSGVNDPVGRELVESLARPGGNTTGISLASAELTAKRVELMRELFPKSSRMGLVYDEDAAMECGIELKDVDAAGKRLGIHVQQLPYNKKTDVAKVFRQAQRANISGLLVPTTYESRRFRSELAGESSATHIPLVHSGSEAVDIGGVLSYGPPAGWAWRRAADYIVRILGGAKASDLPIERPSRYELVVNLKTAKAMGMEIPPAVLLRADRVIE